MFSLIFLKIILLKIGIIFFEKNLLVKIIKIGVCQFSLLLLCLSLWLKVFLHKKSEVYRFLKSKEFIIYDFDKDFTNHKDDLKQLNLTEIIHNRNILETIWGDVAIEKVSIKYNHDC